jgi:hypothetical protein
VELDLDVGEALVPDPQDAREDVQVGRGGEADREATDLAAAGALRDTLRSLGLRENLAGVLEKRAACGCELDAALRPVEEGDPELLLELANLLAEWGLRDLDPRGGATEVQFLRDGEEVAEVPELHRNR